MGLDAQDARDLVKAIGVVGAGRPGRNIILTFELRPEPGKPPSSSPGYVIQTSDDGVEMAEITGAVVKNRSLKWEQIRSITINSD